MTKKTNALAELELIAEEIFQRWDADMRPGKLLSALAGHVKNYDPRVDRIRDILRNAEIVVEA
jgi:hypothetical protein